MDEYKLRRNRLYQHWRFEKFTQFFCKVKGKGNNQPKKIGRRVEQENEVLLK